MAVGAPEEARRKGTERQKNKPKGKGMMRTVITPPPGDWSDRPLDSLGRRRNITERHVQTVRALQRTEAAVDRVFDFLDELVRQGSHLLAERSDGKQLSNNDTTIISEARMAATKFLDKTVPDLLAPANGAAAATSVRIMIGAPLSRLVNGGADIIQGEVVDGESSDLHAEQVGDSDPRQSGED